MSIFRNNFSQKSIASFLVITVLCLTAGPILLLPRKAQAVIPGCPVYDLPLSATEKAALAERAKSGIWDKIKNAVTDVPTMIAAMKSAAKDIWDKKYQFLEWTGGVLLNLLLHQVLNMLTNDIVNWIQNGGEPRFMSMGLGDYLSQAADNAVGSFIDQYLGAGWLCEPFDLDIKLALLEVPTFQEEVECSLSDIVENINDFYEDFSKGGWKGWLELTKPQNNFYGALLLAQAEKMSVEEIAKAELEKDADMGQGFLSPKDCTWYYISGEKKIVVEEQKDVWGTPPLPAACQLAQPIDPHNPGATVGGFQGPCYKNCKILTPASSVNRMANEAITQYYNQINAYLSRIDAGPYSVYIQTIVNALINRVMKEGLLLITGEPEPKYGELGMTASLPKIVSPESALQEKDDSLSLSTQLNLAKQHLEDELLEEQKTNLAVLKLIPLAYSEITPILDQVIWECASTTPYTSYVNWAQNQKNNINNNLIPSLNDRINNIETVEIPKTVNTVNDINTALVSIQEYGNKADAWLKVYEEVNGKADSPELKIAETELNKAKNKVITDTQKPLKAINGTTTATDISGLTQEAQNAVGDILKIANDLTTQRGMAIWPEPGTLYAELEAAQNFEDEANSRLNACLTWTPPAEGGGW